MLNRHEMMIESVNWMFHLSDERKWKMKKFYYYLMTLENERKEKESVNPLPHTETENEKIIQISCLR